jgi:hypothetical protein
MALLWWGSWWLFLFALVVSVALLPRFYPALLPALIFDLTSVSAAAPWWHLALPLTTFTLVGVVVAEILQKHLRL